MIDVKKIAAEAAATFNLSLRDDPTAWPDGEAVMPSQVIHRCNEAALENAHSVLARKLGAVHELIAMLMDVQIHEDGPLADLQAVFESQVTGLAIDLSGVAAATDSEGRVTALRDALARAITRASVPVPTPAQISAYINEEPRLRGLALSLGRDIAVPIENSAAALAAIENGNPSEEEVVAILEGMNWDDEPAPETLTWDDEPEPVTKPAHKEVTGPAIVGLAVAAGITDAELAKVLGFSRPYYSLIRNGKRPWPGMKPDQANALRGEIRARMDAIVALESAIDDGAVLKPEGV